ncbi:unnamed protein product [Vitrella brassicaformis CCMP3155]|uniref:UBA domain-containing protein n=1 Tax=Vitrella brassicaformis (strain CCMP3155) TaxID=1169540 RepID=A0A0G4ESC7_VITBC|nr:unnamed protein product [Vitrella brassicaformis CCMP3155]|eukprot:CEM00775.1 unnamed protein product [Vitrella brassicaformis CCMP3155]
MPLLSVQVEKEDGVTFLFDVDSLKPIDTLCQQLEPRAQIAKKEQRLLFKGQALNPERNFDSYGIHHNATIFLLKHAPDAKPRAVGLGRLSGEQFVFDGRPVGSLGGLQKHVLMNPDILESMLRSDNMQSLIASPDILQKALRSNAAVCEAMQHEPKLAQLIDDIEFLGQVGDLVRQPSTVRELLRATERGAALVDRNKNTPAPYGTLNQGLNTIAQLQSLQRGAREGQGEGGEDEAMPRGTMQYDPSAVAMMMQDPHVQKTIASMAMDRFRQTQGPDAAEAGAAPPVQSDPRVLQHMYHPTTLQALILLQKSSKRLLGDQDKVSSKGRRPSVPKIPRPGAYGMPCDNINFQEAFEPFVVQQHMAPEVKYAGQLTALRAMGFHDVEASVAALKQSEGHVNRAVDILIQQQAAS